MILSSISSGVSNTRLHKDNGGLMGYSMRTDRYRFTVWVSDTDHTKVDAIELYDHQTDPQENTNIANASPELVQQLMEQWKKGWQGAKPPGSAIIILD